MSDDYEGWAILEIMGHRRLGGRLSTATVAGTSLLKIDVYTDDFLDPSATQFYSPAAIYAITPCTEETARRVAGTVAPVAIWELPRPALPAVASIEDLADEHMDELDADDREIEDEALEHLDPDNIPF